MTLDVGLLRGMLKVPMAMLVDDSSIGLSGPESAGVMQRLFQRRQSLAPFTAAVLVFQLGSTRGISI